MVKAEVSMVVKTHVEVLWVMTPCSVAVGYQSFGSPCCLHHPEDTGSMELRNVGTLPQHYMES